MFRQIGSHVGAAVHFFGVSSLLSESVHMYMYIMRKLIRVREKSDIKFFVLERLRLVPRPPARSYEETALLFLYPLELFNRGKRRIS